MGEFCPFPSPASHRVPTRRVNAGFGASHPTNWTGVVVKLIELFGFLGPERAPAAGKTTAFEKA
jgi:hypothetical protein